MIRSLSMLTVVVAAFVLTLVSPAIGANGKLLVGEAAPTLPKLTWLKGDPVTTWEKGHIYVLDFWATWCGPCVKGIPHMNELAKELKDKNVHVIGLAVWTREGQRVSTADFVKERGEGMSYPVAEDLSDGLVNAYLKPADIQGIPTIMIVDQQGRLAYIGSGYPNPEMDGALRQIVAGTYDLEKAGESAKKQAAHDEISEKLWTEFQTMQMSDPDWAKMVDVSGRMLEHDPKRFAPAAMYKYIFLLSKLNEKEKAAAFGKEVLEKHYVDNADGLADFAMLIAGYKELKDEDRDLTLAHAAATKSTSLTTGGEPKGLVALAKVESLRGNHALAAELQTKAIDAVDDEGIKGQLREGLAEYQKAAAPDGKKE